MLTGARIFVGIVYGLLALSFIATTGVMAWEFTDAGWFDHLTTHSHLFLFFPTFGIVSLAAFFIPAAVLCDIYYRHLRFGLARFIFGALVLAAASYAVAVGLLASPQRSAWEIAPQVLLADQGQPASCAASPGGCERLPVMGAIASLRSVSQSRFGLADLVRDCAPDPLFERPPTVERGRYCFATTAAPDRSPPKFATDAQCCRAQRLLRDTVNTWYQTPERRSLTAAVHAAMLPLKVFFLLTLLAISMLLVIWHNIILEKYKAWLGHVEIGLLIGAASALFFPFMSQAFVQSSGALVGNFERGTFSTITPLMSGAFVIWTLLIVLFFYRRSDRDTELLTKIGGTAASLFAAFKYDAVVAVFVRGANSGADGLALFALLSICFAAFVAMLGPWGKKAADEQGKLSSDRAVANASEADV